MRAWPLVAALLAAPAARADPSDLPAPAAPSVSAPRVAAPGEAATAYAPLPLTDLTTRYAGWGMRATLQGRSMDLDAPAAGWARDPGAGPKDIEAGYDWREGSADAVLGYGQFDLGPKGDFGADGRFDSLRRHDGADGVLGFSFVLHGR